MNNSFPSISITKMMYGWTKWGGGTYGIAKEDLPEWFCQICGDKQIRALPSYMFPIDISLRDFVRVCTGCKATAKINKLSFMHQLLKFIRNI